MKKKKYRLGTGNSGTPSGYMPNPSEVLAQNSINVAKTVQAGASNGLANILGLLGGFTMSNSRGIAQAGMEDAGIFGMPGTQTFQNGGTTGGPVPRLGKRNPENRQQWEDRYGGDTQYFIDYLDKVDVTTGRPLRELISQASKKHGVDPNFLYNTAISEGLDRYGYFAMGDSLDSYEREELLPHIEGMGGLDAAENIGLDTIGNVAPRLIEKGYLDPKEYAERTNEYTYTNELGQEVRSAQYDDLGYMLDNLAAFTKDSNDNLDSYLEESGTELSPLGRMFFQNVAYNSGQGNARKMLDSYREKGYLESDSYVYDRPDEYWKDVHKNSVRRMSAMVGLDEQGLLPFSQPLEREQLQPVETRSADVVMANGGKVKKRKMANGGTTGVPIEVEGNEVFETLLGQAGEFKGPSHENGGVDVVLPDGTNIFSDRIKVDGKTMAERKKKRNRKISRLEKLLEKSPSDKALLNSLERTRSNFEVEENSDLAVQEMVDMLFGDGNQKAPFGRTGNPLSRFLPFFLTGSDNASADVGLSDTLIPGVTDFSMDDIVNTAFAPYTAPLATPLPQAEPLARGVNSLPVPGEGNSRVRNFFDNLLEGEGGPSPGDAAGILGDLVSGFGPLQNTLRNRAGDTPNINAYENFGQDALEANDQAQEQLAGMEQTAQRRIDLSRRDLVRRGRNSARGINATRALDLGAELQANRARLDAQENFARMMTGLLSERAGLENTQDRVVMEGDERRDIADRMDRDAFFTQRGRDISGLGTAIQQVGKDLNAVELREIQKTLLDQLSKYGITFGKDMKLTTKDRKD